MISLNIKEVKESFLIFDKPHGYINDYNIELLDDKESFGFITPKIVDEQTLDVGFAPPFLITEIRMGRTGYKDGTQVFLSDEEERERDQAAADHVDPVKREEKEKEARKQSNRITDREIHLLNVIATVFSKDVDELINEWQRRVNTDDYSKNKPPGLLKK